MAGTERRLSLKPLLDIIYSPTDQAWKDENQKAFDALFGTPNGRYPKNAAKSVAVRAPEISADTGVRFAAYIHPSNPPSGPYSGLSFVLFPIDGEPCLIGLGVGTQGLAPDEAVLGKPGHARKAQAIAAWLNHKSENGSRIAWAKQDPTRIDISIPEQVQKEWSAYKDVFDRYGNVMYALFRPTHDRTATETALTAFLDLLFDERGFQPISSSTASYNAIRAGWFAHLMPSVDQSQVADLLAHRRYVILQGPPGTGKTRMATELLRDRYSNRGSSVQFHPNTTYENFIGGLAPVQDDAQLGLRFKPTPGILMRAAAQAAADPTHTYLLHIDEINRADLGKILGEAIFLLEAQAESERAIDLPYDFNQPFQNRLSLPRNLHILGTMNSADRSIAIVDIAVRRRFAFVSLWPSMKVVEENACAFMQERFQQLVTLFIEHAPEDALALVPGHSYFLERDEVKAKESLQTNLAPLLEEYLAQGYVSAFAEPIRAYLQELRLP